eukprot:COSAG01_NODE_7628_length_3121_cov_51.317670_2_plen_91_part_00
MEVQDASVLDTEFSSAASWPPCSLPGRFQPQFRDKNRRDIGKSQSIWTDPKMETAGSHEVGPRARAVQLGAAVQPRIGDRCQTSVIIRTD